jgi:predicted CDP-diglyceride synthetase/phosphatidate cytidylyltransferase
MNTVLIIMSVVIVFIFFSILAVKEFKEFIQIKKESDLKND